MAQVHASENKFRRQPIISRHKGNISGSRSGLTRTVYVAGQKETHVIIAGIVFPWIAKSPYVASGQSVFGAIEYSPESDEVKCHECGEWRKALLQHARLVHGVSGEQYRLRHGFSKSSALVTPSVTQAKRAHAEDLQRTVVRNLPKAVNAKQKKIEEVRHGQGMGFVWSPETANLRHMCKAQIAERIEQLAATLGRTPTFKELESAKLWRSRIKQIYGISVKQVLASLGLKTRKVGHYLPRPLHKENICG